MTPPLALLLTFVSLCAGLKAARAQDLEAVLARMDRQAAAFRDMTARVRKSAFTAVLNETSEEIGRVCMRRSGARVMMKVEFTQPDERSVSLDGSTAQIYYPKIRTVQIYELGRHRTLIDQFSLLGFGTSRRDLERNYSIRLAGDDTVEGRRSAHLELTPKSGKVLEQVKKVELWIPEDAGYPLRQKFVQPGGDYYLITYSEVRLNTGLAEASCRLNLPRNVRREYPQR